MGARAVAEHRYCHAGVRCCPRRAAHVATFASSVAVLGAPSPADLDALGVAAAERQRFARPRPSIRGGILAVCVEARSALAGWRGARGSVVCAEVQQRGGKRNAD